MKIPRRHIAAAAVLVAALVCLLIAFAAALLAMEGTGAERAAWGLISAASVIGAATFAASLVLLPTIRRSLQYARRSRQQVGELAAHHRRLSATVAGMVGGDERNTESFRSIEDLLKMLISDLERKPDTARTHKLLEVTAQKTIEAVRASAEASREEVAHVRHEIAESTASTRAQVRGLSEQARHIYGQVDGLAALYAALRPGTALPPLYTDWAIGADLAAHLVRYVLRERPGTIVELGSGVSTVIIAMALREVGHGHLTSLEHDPLYAARTERLLQSYGVDDLVTLDVAPLVPTEIEDVTYLWYDLERATTPEEIDVLVVDGPPGSTGPQARFPAVPRLRSRLARRGVVFLDDARRTEEAAIVDRWCKDYSLRLAAGIRFASGTAELVPVDEVDATERDRPRHASDDGLCSGPAVEPHA